MADLTSTIFIQGSVGNQSVSWSHTATITDIVDAGTRFEGRPGGGSGYTSMDDTISGTNSSPIFEQLTPNYLFNKNDASSIYTSVQLELTGGVKVMALDIAPGGCAVIMDNDGTGMIDYSATITDVTLIGVILITNNPTMKAGVGILSTLTALKAV